MYRKVVGSREFKVMLDVRKFRGKKAKLLNAASDFWSDLGRTIDDLVSDVGDPFDEIKGPRKIRFYDTQTGQLRSNSYVFRKRVEVEDDKEDVEVTLKFRHPDRYVAQDRIMDASIGRTKKVKTKFEQDLKLPFTTLHSFSTTVSLKKDRSPKKFKDIKSLFPALAHDLPLIGSGVDITPVGDFTAHEYVLGEPTFQINDSLSSVVECALIVWYDKKGDNKKPILVEFSFKHGDPDENYERETAQTLLSIFEALANMTDWVVPSGPTKTQYVYDRLR